MFSHHLAFALPDALAWLAVGALAIFWIPSLKRKNATLQKKIDDLQTVVAKNEELKNGYLALLRLLKSKSSAHELEHAISFFEAHRAIVPSNIMDSFTCDIDKQYAQLFSVQNARLLLRVLDNVQKGNLFTDMARIHDAEFSVCGLRSKEQAIRLAETDVSLFIWMVAEQFKQRMEQSGSLPDELGVDEHEIQREIGKTLAFLQTPRDREYARKLAELFKLNASPVLLAEQDGGRAQTA